MPISKWRFSGVSVQGTSHLEKNIPCQDAHACLQTPSGKLLLAIADGAGSAERSQEGAQLAVQQVIASLESMLQIETPETEVDWQALIIKAFSDALQAVVQLAVDNNSPLSSFATTLACAVLSNDWLAVGQIGDGAIVADKLDGGLFLTTRPMRGEYANEAYFLTMPDGINYLTFYISKSLVRSVVLTTDGLLRLAFKLPEYEPSPKFFQPLLAFIADMDDPEKVQRQLIEFLNSTRVTSRTDDDKTLVIATQVMPVFLDEGNLTGDEGRGK